MPTTDGIDPIFCKQGRADFFKQTRFDIISDVYGTSDRCTIWHQKVRG
jgi:hypothetical protein